MSRRRSWHYRPLSGRGVPACGWHDAVGQESMSCDRSCAVVVDLAEELVEGAAVTDERGEATNTPVLVQRQDLETVLIENLISLGVVVVNDGDHMTVVGDDVTQLNSEGRRTRFPSDALEEGEDLVDPVLGSAEFPSPRDLPDDVVREDLPNLVHRAVLDDLEDFAAPRCVRMLHQRLPRANEP